MTLLLRRMHELLGSVRVRICARAPANVNGLLLDIEP